MKKFYLFLVCLACSVSYGQSTAVIDLEFKDNSDNEESFIAERSIDGEVSWIQLNPIPAAVGTGKVYFSDDTCPIGEDVTWRVSAVNEFGQSGYSNEATLSTKVPNSPGNLMRKIGSGLTRLFKGKTPARKNREKA